MKWISVIRDGILKYIALYIIQFHHPQLNRQQGLSDLK